MFLPSFGEQGLLLVLLRMRWGVGKETGWL